MEAYYISTHTNHTLGIDECKHLPLPPSVKTDIQEQFAAGKSLEKIMDGNSFHFNLVVIINNNRYKRYYWKKGLSRRFHGKRNKETLHYTTRLQVTYTHVVTLLHACNELMYHRNICLKVREFSNHRHLEDAISVDRIVAELRQESPSPILLYKPQGILDPEIPSLAKESFLLVIMTAFQASLFNTFSHRIVCLDSTHKTNHYRFKLLTLVVRDEYRNGRLNAIKYTQFMCCIL